MKHRIARPLASWVALVLTTFLVPAVARAADAGEVVAGLTVAPLQRLEQLVRSLGLPLPP